MFQIGKNYIYLVIIIPDIKFITTIKQFLNVIIYECLQTQFAIIFSENNEKVYIISTHTSLYYISIKMFLFPIPT